MARKFRKNVLRMGGVIASERWLREREEPRKQSGYSVDIVYNGWTHYCAGYDKLAAFRLALESIGTLEEDEI